MVTRNGVWVEGGVARVQKEKEWKRGVWRGRPPAPPSHPWKRRCNERKEKLVRCNRVAGASNQPGKGRVASERGEVQAVAQPLTRLPAKGGEMVEGRGCMQEQERRQA